ncbi:fad NAD binding oxidoreductases [Echinococcus multilocularis]|uniref:Protein yippee-like n=1 Tax=Echinococcus multilocularis TaxID=6211 RepID=A0A087VZB6_ECHMU|nr:fad NAD binding oxidoreductases [Echinococcus multilocularis]
MDDAHGCGKDEVMPSAVSSYADKFCGAMWYEIFHCLVRVMPFPLIGLHLVADIYCECCDTYLGWKYEEAYEPSQKYKEGKYIIELAHLIKDNGWNCVGVLGSGTAFESTSILSMQEEGSGQIARATVFYLS